MAGLGVRQVILRKVDGAEILRRVEQHGVTLMCGAPAVWNAVLDAASSWDGEIPGRGRVRIVDRSGQALELVIDQRPVGKAPWEGELAPGSHVVQGKTERYVAAQGTAMGRAGRVHVVREGGDIWVGGDSVICIEGTVQL